MRELLFLAHRIPYPPDKGDKIRAWHIFRHLARTHRGASRLLRRRPGGPRSISRCCGALARISPASRSIRAPQRLRRCFGCGPAGR